MATKAKLKIDPITLEHWTESERPEWLKFWEKTINRRCFVQYPGKRMYLLKFDIYNSLTGFEIQQIIENKHPLIQLGRPLNDEYVNECYYDELKVQQIIPA